MAFAPIAHNAAINADGRVSDGITVGSSALRVELWQACRLDVPISGRDGDCACCATKRLSGKTGKDNA